MDLSWCLVCDRHCLEENLYCSEKCQLMDKSNQVLSSSLTSISSSSLSPQSVTSSSFSPNSSPLLEPFFSSLSHPQEHRNSIIIPRSPSLSSTSSYPLFAPISDT